MNYELQDSIAILRLDDGKANVVGPDFQKFVNECLDKAAADKAGAVILLGREGMFSAGFDLKEFQKGPQAGVQMVQGGLELAIRLYGLGMPVIAGCTGHGIAMGAFLLLACDSRIGAQGDYRITLPETAISMDIPTPLRTLSLARLNPRYATRSLIQAEVFNPDKAVEVGFLDEAVDAERVESRVFEVAATLAQLPGENYANNKRLARQHTLDAMQAELATMFQAFAS
ncbi:MAG: crotonase/enoyl-CoA hydratase family protein [Pseudomonadota bacterium]